MSTATRIIPWHPAARWLHLWFSLASQVRASPPLVHSWDFCRGHFWGSLQVGKVIQMDRCWPAFEMFDWWIWTWYGWILIGEIWRDDDIDQLSGRVSLSFTDSRSGISQHFVYVTSCTMLRPVLFALTGKVLYFFGWWYEHWSMHWVKCRTASVCQISFAKQVSS